MIADLGGLRDLGTVGSSKMESNKKPQSSDDFSQVLKQKSGPATQNKVSVRDKPAANPEPARTPEVVNRPAESKQGLSSEREPFFVSARPTVLTPEKMEQARAPQDVMLKFMDSVESELGIPPEQIVEAMTSQGLSGRTLPSSEKMEAVMENVAEQLELSPQETDRAMEIYASLMQNQKSILPEVAAYRLGEFPAGLSAGVLAAKEHRTQLNSMVDRLNSKFFPIQTPKPMLENVPADAGRAGVVLPKDVMLSSPETVDLDVNSLAVDAAHVPTPSNPTDLASMGMGQKNQMLKFQNQAQAFEVTNLEAPVAPVANVAQANVDASVQQQMNQGGDHLQGDRKLAEMDLTSGQAQPELSGLEQLNQKFFSSQAPSVAAAAATSVMVAGDETQNVQQILNQAQVMIRRGGGEASVKLSPEGLGEVQLKVMVQDGKVNVEMATETREAKRLIESSLADLKAQLGSHKLAVENVKVDVGTQSSMDQNQQKMDFRQDQNRENLTKFFQQFRDEGAFQQRTQFLEMPEARANAYRKNVQPLSPEPIRRSMESGKGQGLNLVA